MRTDNRPATYVSNDELSCCYALTEMRARGFWLFVASLVRAFRRDRDFSQGESTAAWCRSSCCTRSSAPWQATGASIFKALEIVKSSVWTGLAR